MTARHLCMALLLTSFIHIGCSTSKTTEPQEAEPAAEPESSEPVATTSLAQAADSPPREPDMDEPSAPRDEPVAQTEDLEQVHACAKRVIERMRFEALTQKGCMMTYTLSFSPGG